MKKKELSLIVRLLRDYGKDLLVVGGICLSTVLYIYDLTNSLTSLEPRIEDLEVKVQQVQTESRSAREELRKELNDSSKKFELMSVKLETSLKEISTDLQFIKQRLLEKSLKN